MSPGPEAAARRRVGLLGGTFDPPHDGHLRLAELAAAHLGLDELRFVPAARSPHKGGDGTAPEVRLRLLGLALEGRPWSVETLELARGGTSYTVDTLENLAAREPGTAWILLVGWDQIAAFDRWHRPARIWELAAVAAALRPQAPEALPEGLQRRLRARWSGAPGELVALPSTGLALSSTDLRAALAAGRVPAGIPAQVLAAIQSEALYR